MTDSPRRGPSPRVACLGAFWVGLLALAPRPAAAQEFDDLPPPLVTGFAEASAPDGSDAPESRQASAGHATVVRAASEAPAPVALEAAVDDPVARLSSRLSVLEEELARRKDAAKGAGEKAPADPWTDVSTEKWTVKLGGHVQLDYINWPHADPAIKGPAAAPGPKDYFEFRRLRLVADGTGYGVLDFRLQMTLEPETVGESSGAATTPDVKDAYLSVNEIPVVNRFRIGNFFVPFSLEQVTNDTNNIFLERSIPTQGIFAVDREVGVALYDATDDLDVTWTTGAFFDSISDTLKERIDDNQGLRLSGRLTWLPYYDELSNGRYMVHTGVGILHTLDQDGLVRFRARPQIHEGPRLIDSGLLAAETHTTGNLEFATVWGPFSVQSEAFVSRVDLTSGGPTNVWGAYVYGSWFLTGENRMFERFGQHGAQFGRNVPYSNFFLVPGGSGPGAWELKARWSNLSLGSVDKGTYNDLTVGVNWYWTDRVRAMFDWIHPVTSAQTTFGSTTSDILAMRFDFNW